MFLVALTRFGSTNAPANLEAEVRGLAPVLSASAYELRLALAAVPPVVLASTEDANRARELVTLLRARGHGAVACDGSSVASSDDMISPREFRFEPNGFVGEGPGFGTASIAYADVLLIAEATHARQEEKSEEHTQKKLSLTRSVLTGGLVNTKTTTVSSRKTTEERERVLYVIHRSGQGHVLLREYRLRYTGLESRIGRTVAENFATLRSTLVAGASGARFDDRLSRNRRAGGGLQISGSTAARTVITSNASETDLAVHLLAVADLQQQL